MENRENKLVTLPQNLLEKMLENDVKSKEYNAKVAIETTTTNRRVLIAGILAICVVLIVWIVIPGDVEVDNTATAIAKTEGGGK